MAKNPARTSRPVPPRARLPKGVATGDAAKLSQQTKNIEATIHQVERTSKELHEEIHRSHGQARLAHVKSLRRKPGKTNGRFPIVGIGASAGGLEAVTQLFKSLPPDTGMAFVLVQHLDPTHDSALSSLLGRATDMAVTEARDNVRLEPNHLYIIPPNKNMGLSARRLKLSPRRGDGGPEHMSIDRFFHALAEEEGSNAVGVVLSGNGADGTRGLLAIKAGGGVTFAQDEKTAKYPAMPGHAVAAGCVDFVLPPEAMVPELQRIGSHLGLVLPGDNAPDLPEEEKAFEDILTLLRHRTGVDFTHYKHATLRRRMHRRMLLHKLESLREYGESLRTRPGEVKELFNDILIHVTGFFRDTAVFETLRKRVFPRLLKGKSASDSVRIWIPGCSTGEEAYSVAISLVEQMQKKKLRLPVQIFATDINESALDRARAAIYPESIKSEVSAERLRRFFVRADGGYRVIKSIRELCLFARQNLVNDPPFSNLDLISCRNVLIYLGPTLQRRVMPVFHYALRPSGLLMLGSSETIGTFSDLFLLTDKKAKIYSKKVSQSRPAVSFGHGSLPESMKAPGVEAPAPMSMSPAITDIQKQADRIILSSYSLPGVVINKHFEVLQFRGRTGAYLEHSHGEANLNLLKMAREGLAPELRSLVAKTIRQNARIRQERLRIRENGHFVECNIEVIPFSVPPGLEKFYLVLFEPAGALMGAKSRANKAPVPKPSHTSEMANLREELGATRESLQSIIEEQEATNEELRSANEEIMSSNEELQSTNEELETAKEELQSTNEELTTLNDELESRNTEMEQVNNDLHNLLASVNIPVVILGADLRIRRFTAMAEKMFKLIPGDVGRPITDIAMPLEIPALEKYLLDVVETLAPAEIETQDRDGHWWSMRIRPYKTTDHKIDGAVVAVLDIHAVKSGALLAAGGRDFAEAIINTVRGPLLVLDKKLAVKSANQAFYRTFKVNADETIGRRIYELGGQQWNIPQLRVILEDVLTRDNSFTDFEVEHDFPRVGLKKILLNGRRLLSTEGSDEMILLAMEER